jgi:hypothetical protein
MDIEEKGKEKLVVNNDTDDAYEDLEKSEEYNSEVEAAVNP